MSEGVALGRDAGATKGWAVAAVASGGAIGSLGRWLVALAAGGTEWGTLVVNVSGAFALGLIAVWLEAGVRHPLARPFLSVGLLGGWTTYSTFALDAHALASSGLLGLLGYLAATLALGIGAATVGLVVGDRIWAGHVGSDGPAAEGEL